MLPPSFHGDEGMIPKPSKMKWLKLFYLWSLPFRGLSPVAEGMTPTSPHFQRAGENCIAESPCVRRQGSLGVAHLLRGPDNVLTHLGEDPCLQL